MSLFEPCERKKLLGYGAGISLIVIKIVLVCVVCQYHIPLGYTAIKSINLSCIATAVGFGISAFHTSVLLVVKSLTLKKLQNFTKPLFLKQYIVTCLCIMFLIRYIQVDHSGFEWFKAIIVPVILTLEFGFYRLFIDAKEREIVPFVTPEVKSLRRQSMKNPWALQRSTFTKG